MGSNGARGGETDARYLDWLSGLIDGEGCFTIVNSCKGCHNLRFVLGLRADDGAVIYEARDRLGIGRIQVSESTVGAPGRRRQLRWVIRSKADCRALVAVLDAHPLRTKKARDYAVWREALAEWETVRPGHDWRRMVALKLELEDGRRYPGALPRRERTTQREGTE